jgi:hypothetical protein
MWTETPALAPDVTLGFFSQATTATALASPLSSCGSTAGLAAQVGIGARPWTSFSRMAGFNRKGLDRCRAITASKMRHVEQSLPDPTPATEEVTFDREQVFLLYANFSGDVEKTAHMAGVSPVDILRVVDEEGWAGRLAAIIHLKKAGKPGEVERGMNRVMNFVQAHRLRCSLERMIARLEQMTNDELYATCLVEEKKKLPDGTLETVGYKLNCKHFSDLAASLEKVHMMTYYALNDSMPERARRNDKPDDAVSATQLHAQIAEALAKVRNSKTPRALLFDAQLANANALVKKSDESATSEEVIEVESVPVSEKASSAVSPSVSSQGPGAPPTQ